MKKKFIFLIILVFLVLIIGAIALFQDESLDERSCDLGDIRVNPVSLELAKKVASNQVKIINPEFNWEHIGSISVYNIDGDQESWVFIFRKESIKNLNSLQDLEKHIELFSEESNSEESDKKYLFNDIATIITGAMKEDKLIQRHFRGIPEFFAKKKEIKQYVEENYPANTIGKPISLSSNPAGYEIIDKNSNKAIGKLIRFEGEMRVFDISSLVSNRDTNENIKLTKEECEKYQNAKVNADKANIAEWNKFE